MGQAAPGDNPGDPDSRGRRRATRATDPRRPTDRGDAAVSELNAAQAMEALQPVRRELLQQAAADAHRRIAEARNEAARSLADAREQASELTEAARAAGQAAAAAAISERRAALLRALRREVLAARRDIYQQWRRHGTEAVLRLRDDPHYPGWAAAMRAAAAATLGAGALVTEHPDGGVTAEASERRFDLRLPAIAVRALDEASPKAAELWS